CGVIGVAGGFVDYLLELVARPGGGFAGEFGLAAGEVEVGRSAGCAAVADHVGKGGGVVAALAEQLGGGVDHPGAGVGAAGHGPGSSLGYVWRPTYYQAKSYVIVSNGWRKHEGDMDQR